MRSPLIIAILFFATVMAGAVAGGHCGNACQRDHLTSLFASFGLFGPLNRTTLVFVVLCALAAAGDIGMILELEKGFGGMVHVSPLPMRQAPKALGLTRPWRLHAATRLGAS